MNNDLLTALLTTFGAGIVAGIGWLFKTRRDDRLATEKAYVDKIEKLQQQVLEGYQTRTMEALKRAESGDMALKAVAELTAALKAASVQS